MITVLVHRRVLAHYDVVSWAAWDPQTLTLNLRFGLFFSFLVGVMVCQPGHLSNASA